MSFVFTSDNGLGGALATCAALWSVCSQLRKMIGCRPRSPPRLLKSRPYCLPLFAQTRIVRETRWAGSHLWTGLTAVRDLQLGSCYQREMLWCGSELWIVHWLSRLVPL